MGRKRLPGLTKRGDYWHINKQIGGRRIYESTGESDLEKAEQYLAKRIDEVRNAQVYGVRPTRTFRQAAIKYLEEKVKRSLSDDAWHLKQLDPFIGDLSLTQVHSGTLQSFIEARRDQGIKTKSINNALGVVRHILNLAAGEWIDEDGLTWLASPPIIKLLPLNDSRQPYPLSWAEQERFFNELPYHLAKMALFKVNAGCREHEVCTLQWDWEIEVPELNTSVFIVPGSEVKNGDDRLIVLNRVAKRVVDEVRGQHPEYVFTYKGRPVRRMNGNAWKKARDRAELPEVRVHDLRHTCGRRLRSAGVSFEDRQDLLGHRSGRITTHYSAAELHNLLEAANKICEANNKNAPTLVVLKRRAA